MNFWLRVQRHAKPLMRYTLNTKRQTLNPMISIYRFSSRRILLNLTPGPDMAYYGSRAASQGFKSGMAGLFGVCGLPRAYVCCGIGTLRDSEHLGGSLSSS